MSEEKFTHKRVYVFDIDGTLANRDADDVHIKSGDWEAFHAAAVHSPPYMNIVTLFHDLDFATGFNSDTRIICITGRPEKWRQITIDWLAKHNCYPESLFMRPDDDFSKDVDYKLGVLDTLFGSREEAIVKVQIIFEDRDSLIEGLRNAGFTVAQVKPGTY